MTSLKSENAFLRVHIHTIFSLDIVFYKLFTCIYRANVFRPSEMIQKEGEALKSFIPSIS